MPKGKEPRNGCGSRPDAGAKEREPLNGRCAFCNAQCCRNYTVCLTAYDLLRLLRHFKHPCVEPADFAWLRLVPGSRVDAPTDYFFFLYPQAAAGAEGSGSRAPCATALPPEEYALSLVRDRKETCIFLGSGNYCQVYRSRPLLCRVYPFQEGEQKGDKERDWEKSTGAEESGKEKGAPAFELVPKKSCRCPATWKLSPAEEEQFRQDILQQREELKQNGIWLREWNALRARQGDLDDLLEFLLAKAKEQEKNKMKNSRENFSAV